MVSLKRASTLVGLLCLTIPLVSCSGGTLGESLRRSIAADSRLGENPSLFGGSGEDPSGICADEIRAELPTTFPDGICYPNADLLDVSRPSALTAARSDSAQPVMTQTLWTTTDSFDRVQQFYQQLFEQQGWDIVSESVTASSDQGDQADDSLDRLEATNGEFRVRVSSGLSTSSGDLEDDSDSESSQTKFSLDYALDEGAIASSSSTTERSTREIESSPDSEDTQSPSSDNAPQNFSDLDEAPEELQPYIQDLIELGILTPDASTETSAGGAREFKPNETITRREFAQWLLEANNTIYADQPAKRIRPAYDTAQPAFQDMSASASDFEIIQGLAEAGLIPSSLSGDSTTVSFRPDAPLTRETLILWKAPLDLRRSLPTASVDAVQETWGFQDAARIEPRALRAVLADFQNGDLSNIRRAFGYTTLFQPQKPVTRAEAAAVLWYFGYQGDGLSAQDVLQSDRQARSSPAN
jgi:hypothetical protein